MFQNLFGPRSSDRDQASDGPAPQVSYQWQQFQDADAFAHDNAETLATPDINRCKEICQRRGYGGFVIYKGTAYFRQRSCAEILQSKKHARGCVLWVAPAPQPQQSTPVVVATPVAKASSVAAQPQPEQEQAPAPPVEKVPPAPAQFAELERLPDPRLEYIKDNSEFLNDWLQGLPAVVTYQERAKKAREENKLLATTLLLQETELQAAAEASAKATASQQDRLAVVQELARSRDNIVQQNSPERLASILATRAHSAEQEAESCLSQVTESPGVMDGQALAAFRQRYLQLKSDKHKRVALKERLGHAGCGGA